MASGAEERGGRAPVGYGRQSVEPEDVEAVLAVLRGERLTQGPTVERFEAALAEAVGAPHAVCVSSGTAALHLALVASGVGPGDRVATSANTFVACASAALMCGAEAEFVDIEPGSRNLDPERLEARIAAAGPIRAVVAVHFAGRPCDVEALVELKRRHGFALVEDACHALGATYEVGGRTWRAGEHPEVDATVCSFHPVKHITTAEGGVVLTHDRARAERMRRLRHHGMGEAGGIPAFAGSTGGAAWFRPVEELGYNYRLSDVAAALGLSQIRRLPELLERRRALARRYDAALEGVERPALVDGHAWHLYAVATEPERRDALMGHLAELGVHTQVHYYPVPMQPFFRRRYGTHRCPNAERHARTTLSLPLYPGLADAEQDRVIDAVRAFEH